DAAKNKRPERHDRFPSACLLEESNSAARAHSPGGDHFRQHRGRRKPPLHVSGKENPKRSEQNYASITNPNFSEKPSGRDQQPENIHAPIERKTALEIEEEKAPKLRTKNRRVVSDRNAHQQWGAPTT